jgi:ribulose-5-phosphate 4-epimerase/fuculose-1-phosphate aldolase
MTSTLTERGTHREQREHVAALHAYLTRYQLVTWTSGNVSERVPGEDLFVIKGSGVEYDELTWEGVTVCDLDGNAVDGVKKPSSDTDAHAYVYRNLPDVNGQVHTHSPYATAWAARAEEIPCVLTAMADEFGGPIPVGPFALIPLAGGAHAQPRRLHRRPVGQGRGQGRRDDRGRRPHGALRPPAGGAAADRPSRRRQAVRPLPERLRTVRTTS